MENGNMPVIVMLPTDSLIPYANNPRQNLAAVDAVAASIKEFGFKVPIIIASNRVIVAGDTRLKAAKKLQMPEVPCIVADDLTEGQIKAFRLADNKVAEIATWDMDALQAELQQLAETFSFSMEQFGFPALEPDGTTPYTAKISPVLYEPTDLPSGTEASMLYDFSKTQELLQKIDECALPDDQKAFLRIAASRFTVFNYSMIADYYAGTTLEMQKMMRELALVIIDFDEALEQGFVLWTKKLEKILGKRSQGGEAGAGEGGAHE